LSAGAPESSGPTRPSLCTDLRKLRRNDARTEPLTEPAGDDMTMEIPGTPDTREERLEVTNGFHELRLKGHVNKDHDYIPPASVLIKQSNTPFA